MRFLVTRSRRVHLALVLATIVGVAAGYGVARIHQRPFDMAAASLRYPLRPLELP